MLVRGRSAAFVLGDEVKAAVLLREAGGSDASLSHRALSILAEALSGTMAAIDSLPYDPVANPRALPLMTLAASKFPFAFSRLVDVLCLPSCRSILPVANFSMQDAERVQLAARAVSLFGREARIAEFLTEDTNAVWALLALRVHADSHVCESAEQALRTLTRSWARAAEEEQAAAEEGDAESQSGSEDEGTRGIRGNTDGKGTADRPSLSSASFRARMRARRVLAEAYASRAWLRSLRVLFSARLEVLGASGKGELAAGRVVTVVERNGVRRLVFDPWRPLEPMFVQSEAKFGKAEVLACGTAQDTTPRAGQKRRRDDNGMRSNPQCELEGQSLARAALSETSAGPLMHGQESKLTPSFFSEKVAHDSADNAAAAFDAELLAGGFAMAVAVSHGLELEAACWYVKVMLALAAAPQTNAQTNHAGAEVFSWEEGKVALLVLGLGGGSIPSLLLRLMPAAQVDVLENVRGLEEVAVRFFALPRTLRLRVLTADALDPHASGLREGRAYDAVLLDIDSGAERGQSAACVESKRAARDPGLLHALLSRLRPGGICVANLSQATAGGAAAAEMCAALQAAGAPGGCIVSPRVIGAAAPVPGVVVAGCDAAEASRRLGMPLCAPHSSGADATGASGLLRGGDGTAPLCCVL